MKKKPVYLIAVFSLSHYCVLIRPTNKCSLQCHMIKINQCRAIFTYYLINPLEHKNKKKNYDNLSSNTLIINSEILSNYCK